MKKGLIFIGPAMSGKSRTADIISKFLKVSSCYIVAKDTSSTIIHNLHLRRADLLIIDDIPASRSVLEFYSFISSDTAPKQLILSYDEAAKISRIGQGESFPRRFTVIDFKAPDFDMLCQHLASVFDIDGNALKAQIDIDLKFPF